MKQQKLSKKLKLKKTTISSLSSEETQMIKGGRVTAACTPSISCMTGYPICYYCP